MTCPACDTDLDNPKFGQITCPQCNSRLFHSAEGIHEVVRPRLTTRSNRLDIPKTYVPASAIKERCGICGSTDVVGTGRVQGHRGYRSRKNVCRSCSTLTNFVEDMTGSLVQFVVMDTPTSRDMKLPSKFTSRAENQFNRDTKRMILAPYIGD